ncbi:MAG: nuclear transport factor 2 family protein [Pseudonocardiales bacterium]|nr:nuclear transport factor 2 family protein [Pseudonocardiales bacterium]
MSTMDNVNEKRNIETVERLFDAFRAGDTDAFDALIVDDYVQHNPRGRDGLSATKTAFEQMGPLDVEVHRVIVDGDLVVVHAHYKTFGAAAVDIFRLDDGGKILEHWDVLQQVPATTASGHDMFTQQT